MDSAAFYRRIGRVLGELQGMTPEHPVTVCHDFASRSVRFTKSADKLYYFELLECEMRFATYNLAKMISESWEAL